MTIKGWSQAAKAKGDLDGALQAYMESLTIRQTLAEKDKTNVQWQRGLEASDDNIGAVLKAKGDLDGALQAYKESLAIAKTLAEKDTNNTDLQRDLAASDAQHQGRSRRCAPGL